MTQQKMIVLIGLPASGKSTYAKEFLLNNPSYRRVNKDSIRSMVNFSVWTHKNEILVQNIRDAIICEILDAGYNVVVDDTNLQQVHIDRFISIANQYNITIEFKYFDVSIDECISRDTARDIQSRVGEKVIRRLWNSRTVNLEEFRHA